MQPVPALDGLSWSKIRALAQEQVDAETPTWNLDDPRERLTYERVLRAT